VALVWVAMLSHLQPPLTALPTRFIQVTLVALEEVLRQTLAVLLVVPRLILVARLMAVLVETLVAQEPLVAVAVAVPHR
jgi:hypothetical protein